MDKYLTCPYLLASEKIVAAIRELREAQKGNLVGCYVKPEETRCIALECAIWSYTHGKCSLKEPNDP